MKFLFSKNNVTGYTFILFSLLTSLQTAQAQAPYSMKKGVIYIVRHAEKDTGTNPRLSSLGYARSGDLELALRSKLDKLDRIYVNQYRRTQLTADSVRIKHKTDTTHYVADNNGDGLINALEKNRNKDKRILVIAHSNTIPVILRRLGITDYPQGNIPDNEYDNLYTVTYHKGKAFLFARKYGKSSTATTGGGSFKMLQ